MKPRVFNKLHGTCLWRGQCLLPRTAPALVIVLYYPLWSYRYRRMPQPQRALKNILRISHENKHDACSYRHTEWKNQGHFHIKQSRQMCVVECFSLLIIYDEPRRPDGAPPRRISICKYICKHRTAPPCLGEALRRGTLIE